MQKCLYKGLCPKLSTNKIIIYLMDVTRILAGIVLYNPELYRLKENIDAILPQVELLVLVDNGCKTDDYNQLIRGKDKIVVINHGKNLGIATALNSILHYALDYKYDWVLTLDQDSVSPANLIDVYKEIIPGKTRLGMVCCKIHDRNATMLREESKLQKDDFIEQCITSASMVNVKSWQDVGGFDDKMFIDGVDFDFCLMLKDKGWRIFKTYKVQLLHEVGHSKVIKIFGKEYLSLNHSPFRYYYIIRNGIYVGRKHHFVFKSLLIVARTFWTVLRYEHPKRKKISKMLKGFVDGFIIRISKPSERTNNEIID